MNQMKNVRDVSMHMYACVEVRAYMCVFVN